MKHQRKSKLSLEILAAFLVALILIGLGAYFLPKRVEASWFDDSWAFRKAITLTNNNGSTQNNVEYVLTVDTSTLISASKLQSSCNDLRFTNNSGKILPYFIGGGCNTTLTQVWVLIDSLPTGTADLFMYYGNPSASSGQVPSAQFTNLQNLSGFWPLNEATGAIGYDASGNSNLATVVIGPQSTQTTIASAWSNGSSGQIGGSLNLDGSDDYLSIGAGLSYITGKISQAVAIFGSPASNGASNNLTFSRGTQVTGNRYTNIDGNQGSLSFWFKPDYAYNTGVDHTLFESPSMMRLIYNSGADTFDFGYWNGTDYTTVKVSSASQTFTAGSWIYLAVTWDTDNSPYLQIKINGDTIQQYTSGSFTAQAPGATNYIGSDQNSQNSASGLFDDLIITDHPLRQTEAGTVTTSSTTVTGTGTSFLSLDQIGYQDKLKLSDDATIYTVNAISSATSLLLSTAPSTHASATAFQAGQMTSLWLGGTGSAATLIEPLHRMFYASMDGSGSLSTTNATLGTSVDWTAYDASTNTNGQIILNGTMEAASSGTPTSWTGSGSPTLADAEASNIYSDARSQKITVTGASKGITLSSNLTVSAGSRYKIMAYLKSDGTNRANLRVRNVTASSDIATLGTTSSTWTLLTTDFIIPSGMTSLNFFLESGTAASYSFYVDNVTLWKLP